MLRHRDHKLHLASCVCAVADAGAVKLDPTGTGRIRTKFKGTMRIRWQRVRVQVRDTLIKQNLLQQGFGGPPVIASAQKIQSFQLFLDNMLDLVVSGHDGSVMRPYIVQGYASGAQYAQGIIGKSIVSSVAGHREDALFQLATVELQGIISAVSQQATRAVSEGLLANQRSSEIVRAVQNVIDKVGISRTNAMIELLVVRAHAEATLDIFAAANIKTVGLQAEAKKVAKVGDAKFGAGSRLSRLFPPSASTIGRIIAQEVGLSAALGGEVDVVTAGDFKVCQQCEDIADDGPYALDDARSLIPAHPSCRCVFVPTDDSSDDDNVDDSMNDSLTPEQVIYALPTIGGNEKDVHNPIKLAPAELRSDLESRHEGIHGWCAYAAMNGKTEDVKLSDLVSIQFSVDRQRVIACLSYDLNAFPEDKLPVVIYYEGYSILWDGNHRAAAAYFDDYKTLKVRSFSLDAFGNMESAR
jgi:hypothetical protein